MSISYQLRKFVTADDVATMVEYTLMLALITIGLAAIVNSIGQTISAVFISVSNLLP